MDCIPVPISQSFFFAGMPAMLTQQGAPGLTNQWAAIPRPASRVPRLRRRGRWLGYSTVFHLNYRWILKIKFAESWVPEPAHTLPGKHQT